MTSSTRLIDFKVNRRFRRLTLNTVITLYFLILAGGVVRSTGAGMGCPDWPKCFGSWIPPTEISQLPENYKEIYGAKLKGEVAFNPVKTWIEYVNRLLGAFTGVMIFLTLLASIGFLKTGHGRIFYFSLAAFILVGVQGWLGSKVVSSELMPVMITMHMLLAIVIVFILLYLYTWSVSGQIERKPDITRRVPGVLTWLILGLSLIQILMGTQVREVMDEVIRMLGYEARKEWIAELGIVFYIHRSFSIAVLLANLVWVYKVRQAKGNDSREMRIAVWCLAIVGAEIVTGLLMAYFGVPPFAQPLHLTFAILLIGLQFVVWVLTQRNSYPDKRVFDSFNKEIA